MTPINNSAELTRKDTRAIWKAVCRSFENLSNGERALRFCWFENMGRIPGLRDSTINVIRAMNIPNLSFLRFRWLTVVMPSGATVIITPDRIGFNGDPDSQIEKLCHELSHFYRFGGHFQRAVNYLASRRYRVNTEVAGELSSADGYEMCGNKPPRARRIFTVGWQNTYRVSLAWRLVARAMYRAARLANRNTKPATKAGQTVYRIATQVLARRRAEG